LPVWTTDDRRPARAGGGRSSVVERAANFWNPVLVCGNLTLDHAALADRLAEAGAHAVELIL
jgi:hypothetical protein